MIKRKFDSKTYRKMGCPDLGDKIFIKKSGKKRWGIITLLAFGGFPGAKKGLILIGMEPLN